MARSNARANGPHPVDVAVGRNILRLRILRGVSQEKLAEALGLSFQQVQKYERGANRVSASRLVEIAKALDVSPTDLLPDTGTTIASLPRSSERRILILAADLQELPEPEFEAVRVMVRALAGAWRRRDREEAAE